MTAYSYRILLTLGEDLLDTDFIKKAVDAKAYVERIRQVKKSLFKKMEVR